MDIHLIGLSHHSAPVEVREPLALCPEQAAAVLRRLADRLPDTEAMLLCTCNRTELLLASDLRDAPFEPVIDTLHQVGHVPPARFRDHLYHHGGLDAVRHLFRVACGLDSIALGEHHIVNQLKQAYALAQEHRTTGRVLNRLVASALRTSAHVRRDTAIGLGKATIPSVAIDAAQATMHELTHRRILVIGAGDIARSVCRHLCSMQARHLTIVSRTHAHALALATHCGARTVACNQLDDELADADIVITALRAPHPVLTAPALHQAMRRRPHRRMLILDLAMPRNVEPEAGAIDNVELRNIDTLEDVVAGNRAARHRMLPRAHQIIEQQARRFEQWLAHARQAPLLARLYRSAEQVRDAELQWLAQNAPAMSDDQQRAVEQMAHRLMKKLMHPWPEVVRCHCPHSDAMHRLARMLHEIACHQAVTAPPTAATRATAPCTGQCR